MSASTGLQTRVAIVTGAGAGLGRAYALDLARRGAAVVVNDAGVAVDGTGPSSQRADLVVAEIANAGGRAVANYDSIAETAGVERLFAQTAAAFGRVDILVNNAGIVRSRAIAEMSDDDWEAVIAVHLGGTFRCTHAAVRVMRMQSGGRIINIASGAGFATAYPGTGNYAAAKAGIIALTRVVAVEEAELGITCNAVAPLARTRMSGNFLAADPEPALAPEAVAPFISFLASDAAGKITGQLFRVARGTVELVRPTAALRIGQVTDHWDTLAGRIVPELAVS